MMKSIRLSEDEQKVLELAMECYIRVGLGQFSELARRLDLTHGERLTEEQREEVRELADEMERTALGDVPWMLGDAETSLYTLLAFRLDARLSGNLAGVFWANKRIKEKVRQGEQVDPREAS